MSLGADASARAARASDERRDTWVAAEAGSTMGLELLVAICTWAGIGYLVDGWLGTRPWFLTIGALIGFGGGMYLVWLRSARLQASDDARRAARNEQDRVARRQGSEPRVR